MKSDLIELFLEEYESELNKFIYNNLYHKQYFDDFKQEVLLKICELDEMKLRDLFITNGMFHYAKKCVLNMFNNKYQPYHKTIRLKCNDLYIPEDIEDLEYNIDLDEKLDLIYKYTSESDFFVQLYRYYIVYNIPIKDIVKDLDISKSTLYRKFDEVKKKIKEKI